MTHQDEAGSATAGWVRAVVHLDTQMSPLMAGCLLRGWTKGKEVEWLVDISTSVPSLLEGVVPPTLDSHVGEALEQLTEVGNRWCYEQSDSGDDRGSTSSGGGLPLVEGGSPQPQGDRGSMDVLGNWEQLPGGLLDPGVELWSGPVGGA